MDLTTSHTRESSLGLRPDDGPRRNPGDSGAQQLWRWRSLWFADLARFRCCRLGPSHLHRHRHQGSGPGRGALLRLHRVGQCKLDSHGAVDSTSTPQLVESDITANLYGPCPGRTYGTVQVTADYELDLITPIVGSLLRNHRPQRDDASGKVLSMSLVLQSHMQIRARRTGSHACPRRRGPSDAHGLRCPGNRRRSRLHARRGSQNAADNAGPSPAAAWEACNPLNPGNHPEAQAVSTALASWIRRRRRQRDSHDEPISEVECGRSLSPW